MKKWTPPRILGVCSGLAVLVLLYFQRTATGDAFAAMHSLSSLLYVIMAICVLLSLREGWPSKR